MQSDKPSLWVRESTQHASCATPCEHVPPGKLFYQEMYRNAPSSWNVPSASEQSGSNTVPAVAGGQRAAGGVKAVQRPLGGSTAKLRPEPMCQNSCAKVIC